MQMECPICGGLPGGEASGAIDICTCGEDILRAFREWHKANPGQIFTMTPYGFFGAGWRTAKTEER